MCSITRLVTLGWHISIVDRGKGISVLHHFHTVLLYNSLEYPINTYVAESYHIVVVVIVDGENELLINSLSTANTCVFTKYTFILIWSFLTTRIVCVSWVLATLCTFM